MPVENKIPVIGFAGRSNSGKTTLIEKVIAVFVRQGLKVGVIKHMHHAFELDVPGKDTYRHKKAGAASVVLASSARLAMVKDTPRECPLEEIIGRYMDDADLIIVEGFKTAQIPKIEVYSRSGGEPPLSASGDRLYIAVATDDDIDTDIARFKRDDADGIARFISLNVLRDRQ